MSNWAGRGCMRMGGETKILKGGGQAGSRSGCLKKGRLEPPYELRIVVINTTSEKVE